MYVVWKGHFVKQLVCNIKNNDLQRSWADSDITIGEGLLLLLNTKTNYGIFQVPSEDEDEALLPV